METGRFLTLGMLAGGIQSQELKKKESYCE